MAQTDKNIFGDVDLFALPKLPSTPVVDSSKPAPEVELSAAARGYLQQGQNIGRDADRMAANNLSQLTSAAGQLQKANDDNTRQVLEVQAKTRAATAKAIEVRQIAEKKEAERVAKAAEKAKAKAVKDAVSNDPAYYARFYVDSFFARPEYKDLGTDELRSEFAKFMKVAPAGVAQKVPAEYRESTINSIAAMGESKIAQMYKDRRSDWIDPSDIATAAKRAYYGLRSGIADKWFNEFEGIRTKIEKGETLSMGEMQRFPEGVVQSRLPGGAPASGKLTAAEAKRATAWLKSKSDAEIKTSGVNQSAKTRADSEYSAGMIEARDNANFNDAKWQANNTNASGFRKLTRGMGKTMESLGYSLVDSAPASAAIVAGSVATTWASGGSIPLAAAARAFLTGQAVGSDAAEGARQIILDAPVSDLKKLPYYDRFLKDSNGDADLARKKLASYAAGDAYGSGELLGAVTSLVGAEAFAASVLTSGASRGLLRSASSSALANAMRSPAAKAVIARAAAKGLISTASEGIEEGATQAISNVSANKFGANVSNWDGVLESAGAGIVIGGVMSAPSTVASGVQDYKAGRVDTVGPDGSPQGVPPTRGATASVAGGNQTPAQLVNNFVERGEVDTQALVQRIYTDLQQATPEQRQAYYDLYFDSDAVQSVLSDVQKADLEARFRSSAYEGLNTNPFAVAGVTPDQQAFVGDIAIDATTNPLTVDAALFQAGTTDTIRDVRLAEAVAKALRTIDANQVTTTAGRTRSYLAARADILAAMPDLTADQIKELDNYAATALNATYRRMTDAELETQTQQNAGIVRPSQDAGGAAPSGNNAGSGNDTTPQSAQPQSAGGPAIQGGASVVGDSGISNQTNPAGQVQNNAAPIGQPGSAATVIRPNGQADQNTGPSGSVGPDPEGTPASGGVGGATSAERGADGQRPETPTQTVNDLVGQPVNYGGIEGNLVETGGLYYVQPDQGQAVVVESAGPSGSNNAASLGMVANPIVTPKSTSARVQQALQQLEVLGHTDALSDVRNQIYAASLSAETARLAETMPLTDQQENEYIDFVFSEVIEFFGEDAGINFIMDIADAMASESNIDVADGVENAFTEYKSRASNQGRDGAVATAGESIADSAEVTGESASPESLQDVVAELDVATLDLIAGDGQPTSEENTVAPEVEEAPKKLASKKVKPVATPKPKKLAAKKPKVEPTPEPVAEVEPVATPKPKKLAAKKPKVEPTPEPVAEVEPVAAPKPKKLAAKKPKVEPTPELVAEVEPVAAPKPKKLAAKKPKVEPVAMSAEETVDALKIKSFQLPIKWESPLQKALYILGSRNQKTTSDAHIAAMEVVLASGIEQGAVIGQAMAATTMINTRAKVFKAVGGKGEFDPSMNMADANLANLFTREQVDAALSTLTPAEKAIFDKGVEIYGASKDARNYITETEADIALVNAALADDVLATPANPGVKAYKKAAGFSAILQKIVDRLKKGIKSIAVVSMTLALAYGVASPNTSMAATPTTITNYNSSVTADANAVNSYVQANNDTGGKPYVVADKRGGVVYLYDGKGNLVNEAPALFGQEVSDTATTKSTPAGKFRLSYLPTAQPGYGGSVQSFAKAEGKTDTGADRIMAVHRVWTQNPSEKRVTRLTSKTAKDNRVSNGCINVPAEFYDANLDRDFDGFIYVIPETANYAGNRFGTGVTAKQAATVTPDLAVLQPAPKVASAALANRQESYAKITEQVTPSSVPFTVEGTTPSTTQVALTEPVVVNNVSHNTVSVPADAYTPAEEGLGENFDTLPIADVDAEGTGVSGIVVAMLSALGMGVTVGGSVAARRAKLASRRRRLTPPSSREAVPSQESADTIPPADVTPQAQARIDADIVLDLENRSAWYEFMQNSDQLPQGVEQIIDMAGESLFIEISDKTKRQVINNLFSDGQRRRWRSPTGVGVIFSALGYFNGAKIHLDNWASSKSVPFAGVEQDTSVFSVDLSAMPSRSNAYAHWLEAMALRPVGRLMQDIANKARINEAEAFEDLGQYATLNHLLTEGYQRQIDSFTASIEWLTDRRDAVISEIDKTTAPVAKRQLQNLLDRVKTDLRETTKLARDTEAAINGTEAAWDKSTPIVGGRTREQAQREFDAIKAKTNKAGDIAYPQDQLDAVISTMTKAYKDSRDWGLAHGVFSPADIAAIDSIGYENYINLQSKEVDANAIDTSGDPEPLTKLEELLQVVPSSAVRSLGFAKDPTKLRRKGATTPSDNSYNNLVKVTANYARLAAQAPVVRGVEQMYENVWNDASDRSFSDEFLADLNNPDGSHIEGLVRFKPGSPKPAKYTGTRQKPVASIPGWGHDINGERVRFDYFFTSESIQLEVTRMIVQNGPADGIIARNSRTLTRGVALMLTRFNAMWNVRNVPTDFLERANTMAFRDVVDTDGNPVSGLNLQAIYTKRMAVNMTPTAHMEVARYIESGIPTTPLQRELHAAFTAGAIQLHTDVLNRSEINAGGKESEIAKGLNLVVKGASAVVNSNKYTGKASGVTDAALDKYLLHVSDVPQTISALSAYQSYTEAGVNRKEAGNRVRDQFDPARAPTRGWATALYPFFNSTTSGHYNLWRSVTQAGDQGAGAKVLGKYAVKGVVKTAAIAGLYLGIYAAAITMASLAFGDDEDGIPKLASMSIGSFKRGLPIPMGDEGVYYLPVGHGLPQAMFTMVASMYKLSHGKNTALDVAGDLMFTTLDNTLPVQTASRNMFSGDFQTIMQGALLTASPEAYKPAVEVLVNRNKFTGGKLVYGDTPRGERASEQVKYSTPDAYVSLAQSLADGVLGIKLDMRPEIAQHLFGSVLAYGPLRAVDALVQDKGDKTAGLKIGTREQQGFLMGLTGAGTGYDVRSLNNETLMYAMMDKGYARALKFNVPMTDPENVGKGAGAGVNSVKLKLAGLGATTDDVTFVAATMNHAKLQKKQNKEFKELVAARGKALQDNDPVAGVYEMRMRELQGEIDDANLKFVEDNNEY